MSIKPKDQTVSKNTFMEFSAPAAMPSLPKKSKWTIKAIPMNITFSDDTSSVPSVGGEEEEFDRPDEFETNDEFGSDEFGGTDDVPLPTEDETLDDIEEETDPNKQGVIRYVSGAHLVYKRKSEEGQFEELWIYPLNKNIKKDEVRSGILAGTDIKPGEVSSDDGSQHYELWTAGNAQMIFITGLPQ